jgi:histidyl-tRNA synthetase
MSKPAIPKGTRDFLPGQTLKRKFIFDTIESVFKKYGYRPIETPALELLSSLTGKYGEEGDRLLFKVLNKGDFVKKADQSALDERDSTKVAPSIARRGLRYDLTVPFARFVAMYQNDIAFPFKRYQIQPVWRADRPQKGRYQEFYQCDVDVVGSASLVYEAELIMIYDEVFALLGLPVKIRYNNRKVLAGIAEVAGVSDQMMTMTISVDKLDKIGWEGVRKDLDNRGFTATSIDTIQQLFSADRDQLTSALSASEIGQKGLNELADVEEFLSLADLSNDVSFDVDLARGLNYYTGCIFEVNAIDAQIGSIGGGGRYDDLTSVFGLPNVSGVGISFGAERIYDVLEEKSLFPDSVKTDLDLLLCPMDEAAVSYSFSLLQKLRSKGLSVDMYPEPAKLKKQLKYVHTRSIPFAGIIGSQEMEQGIVQIKDMEEGNQSNLSMDEIIAQFAG